MQVTHGTLRGGTRHETCPESWSPPTPAAVTHTGTCRGYLTGTDTSKPTPPWITHPNLTNGLRRMHLSIAPARHDFISPNNQPDSTKLGLSFRINDVSSHKPSDYTNSAPSLLVEATERNKDRLNTEKSHAEKTDGVDVSRLNQYPATDR